MILFRSVFISRAVAGSLEEIQSIQVFQVVRRVFGQFWHGNAFDVFTYNTPLERIIVQEHHTIKTYVQNALNGTDVINFGLPIRLEHGDVIQLEHHVGVFLEGFLGSLFVVLRGYANDNTTLLQLLDPHLELGEGLANT